MIKKIQLENFQSWKNASFDFDKGFNIIIGNSDSGKTSIFRSIFTFFSTKFPLTYINKEYDKSFITMECFNGNILKRYRCKKDNVIMFNDKRWERIGSGDFPFDYLKEIGDLYISLNNEKIFLFYSGQLEEHFFVNLPDTLKLKIVSKLCGVDDIDDLIDSVNKDSILFKKNINELNIKISERKNESASLEEYINSKRDIYNIVSCDFKNVYSKFDMLKKLLDISCNLKDVNNNIDILKSRLDKISEKISNIDYLKFFNITNDLKKILDIFVNIKELDVKLKNLFNKLQYTNFIIENNGNNNILSNVLKLKNVYNLYSNIIEVTKDNNNKHDDCRKKHIQILSLKSEYEKILSKYRVCPLCKREIAK